MLLLIVATVFAKLTRASNNGQAITPQMGWDDWNSFGCNVSEEVLLSQAKLIVDLGFKDLGYQYILLDDCWSNGRNTSGNGSIIVDTQKFPRGMAAVANSIHDLGLKFGMYSDAGSYTCGLYEGSLGHEKVDAETFAAWGIDYLKYDNCYNEGQAGDQLISRNRFNVMSEALNATGRSILYSMDNWGEDLPWNWAPTIANSWRISGPVYDSFDRPDDRCPW